MPKIGISRGWLRVVKNHYEHHHPRLSAQPKQCYSTHFAYEANGTRFVISRVRRQPRRIPFEQQFHVTQQLHENGAKIVHRALRSASGALWVAGRSHSWFVRSYVEHDRQADWSSPSLIEDAAQRLAEIHKAGQAVSWDALRLPASQLAPYHWPVNDVIGRVQSLAKDMDARGRSRWEINAVRDSLRTLGRERQGLCLGPEGLTHQDYRPENVLTRGGRVVSVIDWDLAHRDHLLYDATLAAVHLIRSQPGNAGLGVGHRFIDAYQDGSGIQFDDDAQAWMLRYVVTRSLAVSRSPHHWHGLFGAVHEWTDARTCVRA